MPFQIVRNDITLMPVDAIVNSANSHARIGQGVDYAIYRRAGYKQLFRQRRQIGQIRPGQAAVTDAFLLPAKYIIHTVGPVWHGGRRGERELLRSCYEESLKIAGNLNCASIAFPLISAGNSRFPKDEALNIAVSAIRTYLSEKEMMIYLVVYDERSFVLSGRIVEEVEAYIDSHYVDVQQETLDKQWERDQSRDEFFESSEVFGPEQQRNLSPFMNRREIEPSESSRTSEERPGRRSVSPFMNRREIESTEPSRTSEERPSRRSALPFMNRREIESTEPSRTSEERPGRRSALPFMNRREIESSEPSRTSEERPGRKAFPPFAGRRKPFDQAPGRRDISSPAGQEETGAFEPTEQASGWRNLSRSARQERPELSEQVLGRRTFSRPARQERPELSEQASSRRGSAQPSGQEGTRAFKLSEQAPGRRNLSQFAGRQEVMETSELSRQAPGRAESLPKGRVDFEKTEKALSLDDMIKGLDDTFSQSLFQIIDAKGKTDVEVYKKANLDRKLFSKIRSNKDYQPSKRTAVALAIALELNLEETGKFLARAGLAFSPSNVGDLIVEYFIINHIYDIYTINLTLFAHGQATL